jgi:hypothetical protein
MVDWSPLEVEEAIFLDVKFLGGWGLHFWTCIRRDVIHVDVGSEADS